MTAKPKILHVLAQRPGLTGSGVTLEALIRGAAVDGWDQAAVVGVPATEQDTFVGGLRRERIYPLRFGGKDLPFPVPGMSDVMPYRSTRFSDLDAEQMAQYRNAWHMHLSDVMGAFKPDLVHSHHVWILSSLIKDIRPDIPVVTHCHATGFRQMNLCQHLAYDVREGCRRNDMFLALHGGHADELERILGVPEQRVRQVGAGFRDDVFHARGADADRGQRILYTGKYSAAKGLPWLLDAVETLSNRHPALQLHVAGTGAGPEADKLSRRMEAMGDLVVRHGQVSQLELAELMRSCAVCVLPSFFEGVPLVLVEALACGCRLVATRLPGIVERLVPTLGDYLSLVPLPRLESVDVPYAPDLPAFTEALAAAVDEALQQSAAGIDEVGVGRALAPFTWTRVFDLIEQVWLDLLET